jgi:hypothetical protein
MIKFTLRFQTTRLQVEWNLRRLSIEQAFHLLRDPSQGKFKSTAIKEVRLLYLHLPLPVRATGFSAGLFRESSLVSFSPLTDMLKFSG